MRRSYRILAVTAALLALAAAAGAASAKPGGVPAIPLNPGQEVNDVDSDAHGFFAYSISGNTLCYTLAVQDLTGTPIGAHIHPGPRNVAGPVAVPLVTPPSATSTVSGCITAVAGSAVMTPEELAAIQANPRAFYVNVHTPLYTPGEIRGQLK